MNAHKACCLVMSVCMCCADEMTGTHLQWLIDALQHDDGTRAVARDARYEQALAAVARASGDDVTRLLAALGASRALDGSLPGAAGQRLFQQLIARQRHGRAPLEEVHRRHISLLYNALERQPALRSLALQWLATAAGPHDLRLFAQLLVDQPPPDAAAVAVAVAPLFQHAHYDPAALFPQLLEALQHVSVAAIVLDLANFLVRAQRVVEHPAVAHAMALVALLGDLVQRLARLEETGGPPSDDALAVRQRVDDSVALIVSLCDTLSLLGESRAVGKLHQALELKHRRIRVAAAAALARLGEAAGISALLALAAEPVVRLLVLATAEELGLSQQVDAAYCTELARAESAVALTLAQPTFFGLPPQELTCIDTRSQFWPGYEEPVTCHLYRYAYRFGAGDYTNIAIAGPLVHAFAADLNDLPPDDIYAAYAGWHAEHESIYEWPVEHCPAARQADLQRFLRRLRQEGYEDVQGVTCGHFLGDDLLVARAVWQGVAGVAIVDALGIEWHPTRTRRHPLGPAEAYCIYKGRRLLRAFNP